MQKWLLVILSGLLLAGCDFTVPLSKKPEIIIDKRVAGLWERTKTDGKTERMLVLPINEYEYFIAWPKGANTELYARAYQFEFSGRTTVQLQWFGNSDGGTPDDNRQYQLAVYDMTGDTLEIRLLNADIVGKDHESSDKLAAAIIANDNNSSLFREKMTFNKVEL